MQFLKQFIGQTSVETFLTKHFQRLPFSCPCGGKDFVHLLNWNRVEEVLEAKQSITRVVKNGHMIKDHAELTFEEAQKYFQTGHTLLLRYAEKSSPALNEIAQTFSRAFATEVDIQLYCTPDGHHAFGWHYDVEEVFIIQTQGCKEYTLRLNTTHPHPLVKSIPKNLEFEKETSDLSLKVRLHAGDMLYIPSGWWHVARTQSESMHVSIGLMPHTACRPLEYLHTYLAKNSSLWRRPMPLHRNFETLEEEVAFYQEAFAKLGENLALQFSSKEFIMSFLKFVKANKESL